MRDLPPQPFEHPGWHVRVHGKTWVATRVPPLPSPQADVGGRYQTLLADDDMDLRVQLAAQDRADVEHTYPELSAPAKETVAA